MELNHPLEIGRQRQGDGDPEPYKLISSNPDRPNRLVAARSQEGNISRKHIHLEPQPGGTVRVTNVSQLPLSYGEAGLDVVTPNRPLTLSPPFRLLLPGRTISVLVSRGETPDCLRGLDEQTIAPGPANRYSNRLRPLPELPRPQLDAIVSWLQVTASVLQSTVASTDFIQQAAEAVVAIVGWTSEGFCSVTRKVGPNWPRFRHGPPPGGYSKTILDRVHREKRTLWQGGTDQEESFETPSLVAVLSVVAAPILNGDEVVIGVLYGERGRAVGQPAPPVTKLEALLIEMLACGIASGMARQRHQETAIKAQTRFEQFFTPEVARRVVEDPSLLEGRELEVTLLFVDIRGFSRISERLGPASTMRWVNDVMEEFSRHVLDERGVLVDYVGDELIAMWGAPQAEPHHADRAVRAALAIHASLDELNRRWLTVVGEPLKIGIGVNTGLAQVGNTGSSIKFKYGPLGNTVNLASRVQSLTKQLNQTLIATEATQTQLSDDFIARRICRARVVNIKEPVNLYEVALHGDEARRTFFRKSEEALDLLEAGEFALAAGRAGELLSEHRGDGPLQLILSRAANRLLMPPGERFDPIWEPAGK